MWCTVDCSCSGLYFFSGSGRAFAQNDFQDRSSGNLQELMKVRIDARFVKTYEKYLATWQKHAETCWNQWTMTHDIYSSLGPLNWSWRRSAMLTGASDHLHEGMSRPCVKLELGILTANFSTWGWGWLDTTSLCRRAAQLDLHTSKQCQCVCFYKSCQRNSLDCCHGVGGAEQPKNMLKSRPCWCYSIWLARPWPFCAHSGTYYCVLGQLLCRGAGRQAHADESLWSNANYPTN